MDQPVYTFFLAHAGADTERAKSLRDHLHPDVSVFLDAVDLKPGDEWDVALPKYQKQARATVALLTSALKTTYYLRDEIANAIAYQRHDPNAHRLIPVYLDGIPSDPAEIPYGVRVQHALNMAELGVEGVAAALRTMADDLAEARPLTVPEAAPVDRFALYDALCSLLPSMFDEVLFRIEAPTQHVAPSTQPPAKRALDVIQWAEIQGGPAMTKLTRTLRKVAPGSLS